MIKAGGQVSEICGPNLADMERAKIVRLKVYIILKSKVDTHRGFLGTSEVSRKRDFKPSIPPA